MNTFKIRHSVVFSLKYQKGSSEEKVFLDAARKLSAIQGVHRFECLRQVSRKNNYDYAFSMEFDSQAAYDAYNRDPAHESFVKTFWVQHVREFLELDFEIM